jgi:predicted thioesterase
VNCVQGKLGEDETSVGTSINISHLAATPQGIPFSYIYSAQFLKSMCAYGPTWFFWAKKYWSYDLAHAIFKNLADISFLLSLMRIQGMKVRAEATLEAINARKLNFKIVVFDDKEKIGEGSHERVVLNKARFAAKANSKLASS